MHTLELHHALEGKKQQHDSANVNGCMQLSCGGQIEGLGGGGKFPTASETLLLMRDYMGVGNGGGGGA